MNIRHLQIPVIILPLLAVMPGCINIKIVNVGQKTAYERQLTGTYEELDQDLATLASVRGGLATIPEDNDEIYRLAITARRRQLFNNDDLERLKSQGCLGESYRGFVLVRDCPETADNPNYLELAERLANEENKDRLAILNLAIQLDATLTPASSGEMLKVFYHLFRAQAKKGYWFEESAGQWIKIN